MPVKAAGEQAGISIDSMTFSPTTNTVRVLLIMAQSGKVPPATVQAICEASQITNVLLPISIIWISCLDMSSIPSICREYGAVAVMYIADLTTRCQI